MKRFLAMLLLLSVMFTQAAFADDVWTMADSDQYGRKAAGMLGRGVVNVATCFVDIVVQTVEGTKNGPPVLGTVSGLGTGIGCGALRVLSGALDVLTFWVPGFNGFPVCKSYANCVDCEMPAASMGSPMMGAPAPAILPASTPAPAQDESPMRYVKK